MNQLDPMPREPSSGRPAPPVRYGTRMLRRFGWFYRALGFGRTMGRVRMEEHSVEQIRSAAEKGPIVYVLARRSTIDHLALNTVLTRRRLPLSVWANGATSFFWQPVGQAWADVWQRVRAFFREGPAPDPVASGWVAHTVASGGTVTVFVDDPAPWRKHPADALETLLQAQELTDRPIQLVPIVVMWSRSPERRYGTVRGFLAETLRPPTFLGQLVDVWLRSREAFIQAGAPLDLQELQTRFEPNRQLRAVRTVLRRYLRREHGLVRGPRLLPGADMKRLVLDNPPMRELARREATALGTSEHEIRRRMEKDYDHIAARFSWATIRLLHIVLRPLWTRVFSGVDVRPEDLERIRTAMRNGTAILVPCHKSHFDYVLLSWVFFTHDLIVPHVVAGMNLAIWPVSILLRGAGGFFIKRSFSGETIFPAVFARYLRELVRHGYPVEFFIEGGRTRSGKLLRPRVGVLGMVLEAAEKRPRGREVTLLPIALAYEQVAEEGVYAKELGGEEKRPESVGQLVKARKVLRRRFGRVYLRVGEPIPCGPVVDASENRPVWTERSRDDTREQLLRLGERVVYRIGSVMVVLPTSLVALALLAHHRRGIRHDDLVARCVRFRAMLQARGAPEAASMRYFDQGITQALDRFLRADRVRSFDDAGERVWGIVPEQRITLDFYKNQVLHYFATASLAAAAIRALPDGPFQIDDAKPGFEFLAGILRREFVLDPDRSATALLQEGLDALVAHGALRDIDGRLEVADTALVGEVYGLLRSLLESYAVVLRSAHRLAELHPKGLVTALQAEREALLIAGAVTRPEALSGVNLRNAVDTFVEDGVLLRTEGGLALQPELQQAALQQLTPMVD